MGTHSTQIQIRHKKKQIMEGNREGGGGGGGGGGGNVKIECKSPRHPFVLCGYHRTNLKRGNFSLSLLAGQYFLHRKVESLKTILVSVLVLKS